jgi:[protein-PII] uridylyltransferase
MREIGPRLGFSHDDVEVLVTLVREHLLLASVATSRDLDDPATIETVARAVHDRTTFDVLLALTEADSIATGESAWSSWKASLLGVLAARVRERFAGVVPGGAPSGPRVEPAVAGEEISVVGQADEMVVVAPDVPGLLATVVGLLALHGQDVRAAEASLGEDGRAVERFALLPQFDREPDWDRFRAELVDALAGRLPLAERLLERADRYRPTKPAAAWIPETRVRVLRGASSHATVLEVRAADEAGLLSRIAGTIAAIGLDIAQARAITMGPEAVDTFYVRDAATGAQVDDRAEEITAWLSAALAPAPAAG